MIAPRRLWIPLLAAGLVALASPSPARAALIVTFQVTTAPTPRGAGTLDVYVASDATLATPDVINDLGFTLVLSGPNQLRFAAAQDFSYLKASDYIFAGDSADDASLSAGGSASPSNYSVYEGDTFTGSDSTASGVPISLTATDGVKLLASLRLDASIANPLELYSVDLRPSLGSASLSDNSGTYFDDYDFANGQEVSRTTFASVRGEIAVAGTTAVPEPASLLMVAFGVAPWAAALRLRRARPA